MPTKAELQTALKDRLELIERGTQNAIKVEGKNVFVSSEDAKALRTAGQEVLDIQSVLQSMDLQEKSASWLAEPQGASVAMGAGANGEASGGGLRLPMQSKSLGEMFTESDEFKALREQGGFTMATPYEVNAPDMPRMGKKDIYTGGVTGLTTLGFGSVQVDPIVPRGQRTNRVRDLFPVAATNANLIDYFRVTGFAENSGAGAAASVPERTTDGTNFGIKPKSNLDFESAQAPVRTIAHWEAAHRNVLSDEPQLQATINNELLYGLGLEEDRQILSGSGTSDELEGLLVVPNTQAYTQANASGAATENKPDAVRRALTRVLIAYYQPTGLILNPFDWEDIELTKSEGSGVYMVAANVQIGAQATLWRMPVVATAAMPQYTFLAGAFGLGAQLYDREVAQVRIAEQHSDFFVRNAIAVLAEERLALATKRPESFVVGHFFH